MLLTFFIILAKKDIVFQLGCKAGILNNWFAFNQLQPTELKGSGFKIKDIPQQQVTIRAAISAISVGNGQGFLKCSCKSETCKNCSCAKADQSCNSRCHHRHPNPKCCNK